MRHSNPETTEFAVPITYLQYCIFSSQIPLVWFSKQFTDTAVLHQIIFGHPTSFQENHGS